MTDKQIIIDGVDVSGCVYYADGKCTNSQMIQSNCKNVAVCYYKQLKRKEQECEELKEQLTILDDEAVVVEITVEQFEEYKKLKQTLTEIKEIAEVLITTTDEYDSCYYKDRCSKCEVKDNCQYFKVEQILQKISEVEENE